MLGDGKYIPGLSGAPYGSLRSPLSPWTSSANVPSPACLSLYLLLSCHLVFISLLLCFCVPLVLLLFYLLLSLPLILGLPLSLPHRVS